MRRYNIIYADPPWSYRNFQGKGKDYGDVSAHYQTMTIEELKALPVREIAAEDCVLFLWATYPNLPEALAVMEAWGFRYATVAFTWVKLNRNSKGFYSGLGFYTNANAEICLLGRKGRFQRQRRDVKQLVLAPLGEHSQKPPQVRDRIVALCGDLPRIELFARERVDGWDAWGDQVPSDIELRPGASRRRET